MIVLFISQTPVTVKSYSLHKKPILQHIPDESDVSQSTNDHPNDDSEKETANSSKSTTAKKSSMSRKSSTTSTSSCTSSKAKTVTVRSKKVKNEKVVTETETTSMPTKSDTPSKRTRTGHSNSTIVKAEKITDVKKIREPARSEWFDETVFSTKRIKHTPKIKKEPPPKDSIACVKCNSVFDTSEELSSHEKKCYVKYLYPCDDATCTKTFSQKSMMNQHYCSAHLGQPFPCRYCSKSFASKKSRDHHEKATHLNTEAGVTFKYECRQCDYKTDDKTEFTSHMDHHQEFKRYKCGFCDEGFYTQSHLKNHFPKCKAMVEKQPIKPRPKEERLKCGQVFSSRSAHRTHFLDKHTKNPDSSEKIYCDLCLFVFTSQKGYAAHCHHSADNAKRCS